MPPPAVGYTVESTTARTTLAVKSLSRLNVPMYSGLLGCLTRWSATLNRGARDDEGLEVAKFKKRSLGVLERESMKDVEVHIGRDPKSDNYEEQISKKVH